MNNYSDGPWYASGANICKDIGDIRHIVGTMQDWAEDTSWNARLAAAAPELLEALEQIVLYDPVGRARLDKALVAIEKATGKHYRPRGQ